MAQRSNPVRIANVLAVPVSGEFKPYNMALTRCIRMSQSLARIGYQVDIVVNAARPAELWEPRLRFVGASHAPWDEYDVIKANYPHSMLMLVDAKMDRHPFIISRLGAVVTAADRDDVPFHGGERDSLWHLQQQIDRRCRYVTVLTERDRSMWEAQHGLSTPTLLVPTGVDEDVPAPKTNPYAEFSERIVVYIGNLRGMPNPQVLAGQTILETAPQLKTNIDWQQRLNQLGRLLQARGIRLCFIGTGRTDQLDSRYVTCLGRVENDQIWDYQYFADAGLALAHSEKQHVESSKIYYYLRAGLPVVCEQPIPNNVVVQQAHLGLIAPYRDNSMIVERLEQAISTRWDRARAQQYMIRHHSWGVRASIYDKLIREELSNGDTT